MGLKMEAYNLCESEHRSDDGVKKQRHNTYAAYGPSADALTEYEQC